MSIYRLRDVMRLTGLSRSTIYALMQRGEFPKSVHLTKRSVGWQVQDVDHWLNSRRDSTVSTRAA